MLKYWLIGISSFSITIILVACGGGGGGGSGSAVSQGVFLDSAVEGLRYETGTREGMTDAQGTFQYLSDETVSFYVGDVLLGSATGAPVLTPVDLVSGASNFTHTGVTNIARFLQTLDNDGDPFNGIRILPAVFAALLDQDIDFDRGIDEFENDPAIGDLIEAITGGHLGGPRPLVSVVSAQAHLAQTLAQAGVGSGSGSGPLTIAGDPSIGNSFTPDGQIFPVSLGPLTSIQMNSQPRPDNSVIGMGISFNPGNTPFNVSLVWQHLTQGTRFFGLSCEGGIDTTYVVGDCSGVAGDFEARQITFSNVVLHPTGPGNVITLNGTLQY